jgi:hypothetical protein
MEIIKNQSEGIAIRHIDGKTWTIRFDPNNGRIISAI